MFEVSDGWKKAFPGAHAGVLVINEATNPDRVEQLEKIKQELMEELRREYGQMNRPQLEQLPALNAYAQYYKRFKKTYHIQLQLESILFKDKSIPGGAGLVQAMFMAEMKDFLLTAGHDLDWLETPLRLDVSQGTETYTVMRGEVQTVKAGDMIILDGQGIISNIIYGPDQRTQIRPTTRYALYTTYAPVGIPAEAVREHLQRIETYIKVFAPGAQTKLLQVFG
jgi:DNA/RNA-binding domain of Phe-tRNA-synthetase-like protein